MLRGWEVLWRWVMSLINKAINIAARRMRHRLKSSLNSHLLGSDCTRKSTKLNRPNCEREWTKMKKKLTKMNEAVNNNMTSFRDTLTHVKKIWKWKRTEEKNPSLTGYFLQLWPFCSQNKLDPFMKFLSGSLPFKYAFISVFLNVWKHNSHSAYDLF